MEKNEIKSFYSILSSKGRNRTGRCLNIFPFRGGGVFRKEGGNNAFTLVELIIVITILAVLATIAFISFQGYTKSSRDANRMTTIKAIESGLEIYQTKTGKYPMPDDEYGQYVMTGTTLNHVGYAGEMIVKQINMNQVPVDPLTNARYIYGVSADQRLFQVAGVFEDDLVSYFLLDSTYADSKDNSKRTKLKGNYAYPLKLNNKLRPLPSLLVVGTQGSLTQSYSGSDVLFITDQGQNLPTSLPSDESVKRMPRLLEELTGTSIILQPVSIPTDMSGYKKLTEEEFKATDYGKLGVDKDKLGVIIFGKSYVEGGATPSTSSSSSGGGGESSGGGGGSSGGGGCPLTVEWKTPSNTSPGWGFVNKTTNTYTITKFAGSSPDFGGTYTSFRYFKDNSNKWSCYLGGTGQSGWLTSPDAHCLSQDEPVSLASNERMTVSRSNGPQMAKQYGAVYVQETNTWCVVRIYNWWQDYQSETGVSNADIQTTTLVGESWSPPTGYTDTTFPTCNLGDQPQNATLYKTVPPAVDYTNRQNTDASASCYFECFDGYIYDVFEKRCVSTGVASCRSPLPSNAVSTALNSPINKNTAWQATNPTDPCYVQCADGISYDQATNNCGDPSNCRLPAPLNYKTISNFYPSSAKNWQGSNSSNSCYVECFPDYYYDSYSKACVYDG